MTFKHQVCPRTTSRPFKASTEHIWLSDDLIHSVFHQFILSRISRRHGSFVPGPLEARRRAAKRRMMNLAEVREGGAGGGGGIFDFGFLTGNNPGQDSWGWQWQGPKVPPQKPVQEVKTKILKLPSWLTDHTPKKVAIKSPRPAKPRTSSLRTFLAGQSPDVEKEPTRKLIKRLTKCDSLVEIQKLAVEFQVNGRLKSGHSQLAFRHLLQTKCKLSDQIKDSLGVILQFLEDPSLNNAESQNIQTFFRWYVEQNYGRNHIRYLLRWLRVHVSLGCMMGQELLLLVQSVSNPREIFQNELHKWNVPLVISESLGSSTVFQIHDINAVTLNVLLESMSYGPLSPRMELSGFKILQSLHESQLQQMEHGIASFLRRYLLAENPIEQQRTKCTDRMSNVSDFLQTLPENITISIMTGISRGLLGNIKSASDNHPHFIQVFDAWCSFLTNSDVFKLLKNDEGWHRFEYDLLNQDIGIVGLYLQSLTHDEKDDFLRRTWLSPKVSSGIYYPFVVAEIEKRFSKTFTGYSSIQYMVTSMFQALGTRISTINTKLPGLLQVIDKLGMDRTVLALIHCFQERGICIDYETIISQITKHATTFPHIAYYLFKRTRHLPLESCPAVAEIMIYNPRFNPGTALAYRRQRKKFLQVFEGQVDSQYKIMRARIELLQRMAIAYAHAPHLFPRVAFRQVYECYRLHRQYNLGPLSVEMSSALTIAGIVKPLQESEWTATEKVKWILTIVSEVEGEAVATRVDELVYTWRGLVHREMEVKRMKAWRDEASGIDNPEAQNERRRRHFRAPFSAKWRMWGKTKDESRIRRVLWTLDLVKSPDGSEPQPRVEGMESILASDVLLWMGIERFRYRTGR